MNDAAQGAVEDVPQDVAQDLGFRARAARALLATPPPPPPCLCALRAEMGAQLGSSVAFATGCGQTLPGVPRKAPLCSLSQFAGLVTALLLPLSALCFGGRPLWRGYAGVAHDGGARGRGKGKGGREQGPVESNSNSN